MQEFPLGIRGTRPCPALSPGVHPPAAFRPSSGHEWKFNSVFCCSVGCCNLERGGRGWICCFQPLSGLWGPVLPLGRGWQLLVSHLGWQGQCQCPWNSAKVTQTEQ